MEGESLLKTSKIRQKFASCFAEKPYVASNFCTLIMGPLITTSLVEATVYSLVEQEVKASHLPSFTLDILLVSFAILEVLVAPFLGWAGTQRRKKIMFYWMVALIIISIPPFFLPSFQADENTSEFCQSQVIVATQAVSTNTIIRLVMLLPMVLVAVFTRITVWSHGLGYFCEHPGTGETLSSHMGTLLLARIFAMVLGVLLIEKVVQNMLWTQLLFFIVPSLMQLLQFSQLPPIPNKDDEATGRSANGYGFFQSLGRITSNWLVMSQVLGIGFLAAALWGYGYTRLDVYKVQYHMWKADDSIYNIMALNIFYASIFVIVMFWGVSYSAPVMPKFNKTQALKLATMASLFVTAIYIVTAFLTCDKGTIAGLTGDSYNQPTCSSSCRCIQNWDSLDPVCVIEQNQAITYLSPCHAGCGSLGDLNGISVLSNCTCSPQTSRATVSACSVNNCLLTYNLHRLLFLFILLCSILAFQAQIVVILKSVAKRDASITFGVILSVVSLFALVCGHLGYLSMRMNSCTWSVKGSCQLHNSNYPRNVAITSGVLSFIAVIISLVGHIVLRRRKEDPTPVEMDSINTN